MYVCVMGNYRYLTYKSLTGTNVSCEQIGQYLSFCIQILNWLQNNNNRDRCTGYSMEMRVHL